MEKDFLQEFIDKATKENDEKIALEKRKKYFQELGRKGGLKKKENEHLNKIISFRMTDLEYEENVKKSKKYKLKLSTYVRMVYLEKEFKIDEFKTDETLLEYGNNFKRITNLLRNSEWNEFENKKNILLKIEKVIELIHHYLYSKVTKNE